ncbi:hypothetical protein FACS1894204_11280 [Synergistales bacterium]|nr:hypothetical protein FACS1894204_11280 [Synergistales bacterium]
MTTLITVSGKGQITIPVDFFSLRGCLGKVDWPKNDEDLFAYAVAEHTMESA